MGHDPRTDLCESLAGALTCALEQIEQMRGMFPDDDGQIEGAVAARREALREYRQPEETTTTTKEIP